MYKFLAGGCGGDVKVKSKTACLRYGVCKTAYFLPNRKKSWGILHISGLLLLGFSVSGSTTERGRWTNMNKGNVLTGLFRVDKKTKQKNPQKKPQSNAELWLQAPKISQNKLKKTSKPWKPATQELERTVIDRDKDAGGLSLDYKWWMRISLEFCITVWNKHFLP